MLHPRSLFVTVSLLLTACAVQPAAQGNVLYGAVETPRAVAAQTITNPSVATDMPSLPERMLLPQDPETVEQDPESTTPFLEADEENWQFSVIPYFWVTDISGTQRINSFEFPLDASFSELWDDLDFAFQAAFVARKGRWAIMADGLYFNLESSEDVVGPITADAGLTQAMFEIDGAYSIDENQYLDVFAGVRYTYIENEFDLLPPPISVDKDQGWFDPVIGIDMKVPLAEKWGVFSRLDFAGLRSNSHSWQMLFGGRYRASQLISLNLAYRVLNQDYERSDFHYDAQMEGLMLGLGFHW